MNNQRTPDEEFDKLLSEHSGVSELYQQSQVSGPSQLTDTRILASARATRWQIPVSIAASIAILAVIVVLFFQTTNDSENMAKNEQQSRQFESNLKPNPERLLDNIVILIKNDDLDEAKSQFEVFRQLYGDYAIDFEKYPELEKFKQNNNN